MKDKKKREKKIQAFRVLKKKRHRQDSNPVPSGQKPSALPAELRRHALLHSRSGDLSSCRLAISDVFRVPPIGNDEFSKNFQLAFVYVGQGILYKKLLVNIFLRCREIRVTNGQKDRRTDGKNHVVNFPESALYLCARRRPGSKNPLSRT